MEKKTFEVTTANVVQCWKCYEHYMEEYRKTHYSDDKNYDEFVSWCENELYECPGCGRILIKDEECTRLFEPFNSDDVCDYCIYEAGYYD